MVLRKPNHSKSPLILFDVDSTLIVNDFRLYEDQRIKNKIYRLQREGVYVGIVTNRSVEMAQPIYEELHLNGPFLVELGANLVFERYKVIKKSMMYTRLVIVKFIIRFYATIRHIRIEISNNRRYTISVFIGKKSDINKMRMILDTILQIIPNLTIAVTIRNHRIYIRDKRITKHLTTEKLIPNYSNIYVIGDAEHDAISDAIHYLGVCNSRRYYSRICEYNTKKSGVDGIVDLLDYINKHIRQ